MTTYESTLSLAFGAVDVRDGKRPFCIRLEAGPLADLIRATESAHRVYELLLIDRPGDVWDYVWVVLEALPQRIANLVALARQNTPIAEHVSTARQRIVTEQQLHAHQQSIRAAAQVNRCRRQIPTRRRQHAAADRSSAPSHAASTDDGSDKRT